jgi:hypothetical protein
MGMGLRALSEQAGSTLNILEEELDETILEQNPKTNETKKTSSKRPRRN